MSATKKSPRTTAPPAPPEATPTPRLAGLDGLRAIAVIAVIAFHFLPKTVVGGYVGVDVFFVISGFLITGLLVRERRITGRVSLTGFWLRRARRLLPALVVVVAVCAAAAFFIGGDVLVGLGSQVLGAATFSSNWLFIAEGASYFDASTPELFTNLWSLAVEEQFYLLWPALLLLLLLIPHRVARIVVVVALAAASAVAMVLLAPTGVDPTRAYYGTDSHSFGLALGAALALLLESRFQGAATLRRAWRIILPIVGAISVIGIGVIAALLPENDPLVTRGGLALVALLTVAAIAGATATGSWLGRALDVLPLRWVGERSYGLYLWHWPVIILLAAAIPRSTAPWVVPTTALVVTVAAAWLSYRFVEQPVRRHGLLGSLALLAGRAPGIRFAAIATGAALIATIGLAGAAIAKDPGRGEAQAAIEAGQQAIAEAARPRPQVIEPDAPPPLPTGDQMIAIGDSVMLAAAPELQAAFPGIAIDAVVSRQMRNAPEIAQAIVDAGTMRPILLLGLGTNGSISADTLENVLAIVGPKTLMIVVNVQAPRDWVPGVNSDLATFARLERDVELANWHDAIQPRLGELASDEIHPGGPISGGIYVSAVSDALQRLAELPELLRSNEYGLNNRPV